MNVCIKIVESTFYLSKKVTKLFILIDPNIFVNQTEIYLRINKLYILYFLPIHKMI